MFLLMPVTVISPANQTYLRDQEVDLTAKKNVSPWRKLGQWFDEHSSRLGWMVCGLLIGLLFGWWAGGFLSCSLSVEGCEVRADSVSAAGTWFGAIGTVAAVLTAVAAFRAEERNKRNEVRRELLHAIRREKRFADEANRVRIECHANHTQGGRIRGFVVSITNGTDQTPIFQLKGHDFAGALDGAHKLDGGKTVATSRAIGHWSAPENAPVNDPEAFERWCERDVAITFRMNGRRWQRTGHADAELVDDWEAEGPDAPSWD